MSALLTIRLLALIAVFGIVVWAVFEWFSSRQIRKREAHLDRLDEESEVIDLDNQIREKTNQVRRKREGTNI